VGDSALLAHNAPFDIGFLRHYALLLGLEAPANRIIDTRDMSRRLFPGCKAHSLDALALRLGVRTSGGKRHRSLADACIAAECYLAMNALYR
jgi:DNA polymerase III epsilon subunit-like protein